MRNKVWALMVGAVALASLFWLLPNLLKKGCGFAGSFPCAESYGFNVPQSELNQIIADVKLEYPELRPENDSSYADQNWYYVNFRYGDTHEIVCTVTSGDSKYAVLVFIGLDDGTRNGQACLINRDFGFWANRRELAKFKSEIVTRIEERIEGKRP